MEHGSSCSPGHTLPSSSDTTRARHPWPSASHDLPEFGRRCPESGGTGTREGRLRFASGPGLSGRPPSLFPPLVTSPAATPQAEAYGPRGLLPCCTPQVRGDGSNQKLKGEAENKCTMASFLLRRHDAVRAVDDMTVGRCCIWISGSFCLFILPGSAVITISSYTPAVSETGHPRPLAGDPRDGS